MTRDESALDHAAHALVDAIAHGATPRDVFAALTALLAAASRVEGIAPRKPASSVAPVSWSLTGSDALRHAAHGVYRTDSSVETRVRELHSLVAPYLLTGEMPQLAWELRHAWGDVATSLVRPLWELGFS